jgi:hypothetical protein
VADAADEIASRAAAVGFLAELADPRQDLLELQNLESTIVAIVHVREAGSHQLVFLLVLMRKQVEELWGPGIGSGRESEVFRAKNG